MRELRREIDIDAPPAAVWAVLTDTRSYSEWNPFMPHLVGELREGAKLEVRIEPPGGRAMTFKATVVAVEPDRELRRARQHGGARDVVRADGGVAAVRHEGVIDQCSRSRT